MCCRPTGQFSPRHRHLLIPVMIFGSLSDTALVRFLGLIVFFKLCIRILYYIYDYLQSRFLAEDIANFGEWAVITGSTDGIGKAIAREMAKKGINIILISRNKEKLNSTATELENDFHIKTFCIQADFTDRNCYSNIREGLKDKDIGILVNNVGIIVGKWTEYTSISEETLWDEIEVNCGAVAIMTRIVLPHMKTKKKGLIINMSSFSTVCGFPLFGLYPSSKSFMNTFSYNIEDEFKKYNIKVKNLIPAFVNTKLVDEIKPLFSSLIRKYPLLMHFFPDAKVYACHAMKCLSSNSIEHTGYWPHSIMELLIIWLPLTLRLKVTSKLIEYTQSSYSAFNKNKEE